MLQLHWRTIKNTAVSFFLKKRRLDYFVVKNNNIYNQYAVMTEFDLGIPLLLIDPDTYGAPTTRNVELAAEDSALLNVKIERLFC